MNQLRADTSRLPAERLGSRHWPVRRPRTRVRARPELRVERGPATDRLDPPDRRVYRRMEAYGMAAREFTGSRLRPPASFSMNVNLCRSQGLVSPASAAMISPI